MSSSNLQLMSSLAYEAVRLLSMHIRYDSQFSYRHNSCSPCCPSWRTNPERLVCPPRLTHLHSCHITWQHLPCDRPLRPKPSSTLAAQAIVQVCLIFRHLSWSCIYIVRVNLPEEFLPSRIKCRNTLRALITSSELSCSEHLHPLAHSHHHQNANRTIMA